jgi:hypothetical protein
MIELANTPRDCAHEIIHARILDVYASRGAKICRQGRVGTFERGCAPVNRELYARETPLPTMIPVKPRVFSVFAIVCTISGLAMAHELD